MGTTHGLGPLEMQVLGLLRSEALGVSEVRQHLSAAGSKLAYTTVMTVLVRLHQKGLVEREKQGSRFVYSAARKAPRVSGGILARVGKALFDTDRAAPLLALLDDAELTDDDLKALRRAIDAKLRESKP